MKYLFSIVFLLATILSFSQKKKEAKSPQATTSNERWEGYQQRLKLEATSLVKEVPFRNVGPTVMSGRVVDLEVNPQDPTHFYVAYASGSLWETKNNGTSFTPIFDNQIVMTIGDIAVDWSSNTVYVGTGENNSSRSSYSGYGLYKSNDNGETWEHLGLSETHHIGRILIHPQDPNTLWVAALGHLYSENEERGIYKSTDGGKSWVQSLYVNDRSGVIELVISPEDPNIMLAASWEKDRKAWDFTESGDGTGIYRSEDSGDTWSQIEAGSGFPDTKGTGRIGLDFSISNPSTVYAILDNQDRREKEEDESESLTKSNLRTISKTDFLALENKQINAFLDANRFPPEYNAVGIKKDVEGNKIRPSDLVSYLEDANSLLFETPVKGGEVYKSVDAGKTWSKTHEGYIEDMIFSYGYYFGQIRVDPSNANTVYTMGVPIVKSQDGGATWTSINEENVHVDHHALWINPSNGNHLILGNDGGVYISYDQGENWINCNSPAVGQFYSVNIDMATPYNVYGGLQDNGVWKGPSTYDYDRAWYQEGKYRYERLMGGDGMQVEVDKRDNSTVYTGFQFGNYFKIDTKTGKRTYITPKHTLGEARFRWNWEAPILLSRHNQDIVYMGSNRFHRSMNQASDFETLSDDLTNGGIKGDVSYGTLTTISESPLQFGLIYVGSDDGLVHVSSDIGNNWKDISGTLPKRYWVSQVAASSHQTDRVYVSLNGYRWDNFEPLIYVSEDKGSSWKQIGLELPKEPVNVIKEDPENEDILYVGTDHGIYVSLDRGITFHAFSNGLPNAPVHDLVIHPRDKDLIVGTHGRSIYIADISYVQQLTNSILSKKLHVFPPSEVSFKESWGGKIWNWAEVDEPKSELVIFTSMSGTAKVEVSLSDAIAMTKELEVTKGLNFLEIVLECDASFKDYLTEEQQAFFKEADNGDYYLIPGTYSIKVTIGEEIEETQLVIKEPKKIKRKE